MFPRDAELAELAWVRSMSVAAAIDWTNHVLLAWRRAQNGAAAERARSAVARAQDAARSAAAIREDLSIGRTVRQAERAAAAAEAALEPQDADWSAAMAVSAADRAQDLLTILLDEVRSSLSTLSAVRQVKDDAEAGLARLPPGTAMALGTAMRTSWGSAEHAAKRGEKRAVEAAIKELRALAERITDEAKRAQPPPLPLSRVVPGKASNPTSSPSDFDSLGIEEAITAEIDDVRPPMPEDEDDAETHTTIMTREQLAQRVQRAIAGDGELDDDTDEEDEDDAETQQTVLFRRPVGAGRADDDPTRS